LAKSTYEKEMLTIIHVVQHWNPYVIDRHFIIKKDHHSLKYFLEQRISIPEQQKWIPKLLVYDYDIVYKKGTENVVVDALSQKFEEPMVLQALSSLVPQWLNQVKQEWL